MVWEVKKSQTLHEDHWNEAILDTVSTPSVPEFTYFYVRKKEQAAVIVAQNSEHKIALVKIYRHPVKDTFWQIPVEGIQSGEDDIHGAIRGVKEELSLYPETVEKIAEFYIDPGTAQQTAKIYLATDLQPLEEEVEEEATEKDMIHEIGWFTTDEIETMISSRLIRDSWTVTTLSYYQNYLKAQSQNAQ
jgi:ADP-ribose pyrophosphatase